MNTFKQHSGVYPFLMGLIAFIVIAGPQILDPTNVAWIAGGDPLQHYLGWAFYRNSPWSWPIGLNPLYGLDFSNSIVFTDSIPLLAMPLKVISQFLPYPFQYQGIWVLLCFILQAYFSFRLIGLASSSILLQCLGSIFFLFSPPLIFRLSLHESLMGHFLILAALYLNLKQTTTKYFYLYSWIILLSIAVLTHFYLAVMVFVLWLSSLYSRVFLLKNVRLKDAALEISMMAVCICIIAWQAGYFAIQGASGATRGFGDFRTNLLALINSRGWSYWIKPIPLRDSVEAATGEGFQFLGAGSLLLFLFAMYGVVTKKFKLSEFLKIVWTKYWPLCSALVVLTIISFSNRIGIGPWNFTIPLPEFIFTVLSIIRASARLFWPMYYALIMLILWTVLKSYSYRSALIILCCAAVLQVIDTSAGWLTIREKISAPPSSKFNSRLVNPFWDSLGPHYQKVVTNDSPGAWEDFGLLASKYKMATNITYLARADREKEIGLLQSIGLQLYQGPLDQNSLYILRDWKNAADKENYNNLVFNPNNDLLARVDGFNVLAPGWKKCQTCPEIDKNLELAQLTPVLNIGQKVQFTKAGNGRANFMLGGWGYTEDWGTWSTMPVSTIVLPMPKGDPTKLLIQANAFLPPSHPQQIVDIMLNGARVADHVVLDRPKDNRIEVKLPIGLKTSGEPVLVEFRSINAVSPLDVGLAPDDRKLGIGLVSIEFVR